MCNAWEKTLHIYANPKRFLKLAGWLTPILFWGGLVLSLGAMAWGLLMVPPDRLMDESVRILFIHVPAAWLGMGGWTGLALSCAALISSPGRLGTSEVSWTRAL